jgi:hypothetical protein
VSKHADQLACHLAQIGIILNHQHAPLRTLVCRSDWLNLNAPTVN